MSLAREQQEYYPHEHGGKAEGLKVLKELGYDVPYFTTLTPNDDIESLVDSLDSTKLWAVRSSANVEDTADASFAGQFTSVIGIESNQIIDAIETVVASKDTQSVHKYAEIMGIDPESIEMNIVIQEFEEPLVSGVWIGSDANSGVLEWLAGRGEKLVGGSETPFSEVHVEGVDSGIKEPLTVDNISVASICLDIQRKVGYSADVEFCITPSGLKFVQLRKAVVAMMHSSETSQDIPLEVLNVIARGEGASLHKAAGQAYRKDLRGAAEWSVGNIMVAKATSPEDMLMIMTSVGVVTELGGRLSHAAVVCRELGKACIVGVDIAKIEHDTTIEVDGFNGVVRQFEKDAE